MELVDLSCFIRDEKTICHLRAGRAALRPTSVLIAGVGNFSVRAPTVRCARAVRRAVPARQQCRDSRHECSEQLQAAVHQRQVTLKYCHLYIRSVHRIRCELCNPKLGSCLQTKELTKQRMEQSHDINLSNSCRCRMKTKPCTIFCKNETKTMFVNCAMYQDLFLFFPAYPFFVCLKEI